MIFELNKSDFLKCEKLINEQGQLEVKAVVQGVNPGRIFVDNLDSPDSGLIWLGNNDGFFFIGNEKNETFNNEIKAFVNNVIMPEAKKIQLNWFEGIGNHPKWNKTIEKIFDDCKLGSWNQKVYTLKEKDYRDKSEPMIKQEYVVQKISRDFYENNNNSIENYGFLHSKILEFWSSPETFFKKGFGYCIVHKNKIVSICFSGFVVGNMHCIDIETLEDYRGNKLAQKIASRYVKDCFENGIVPYWDCMETNKSSIAVSENLGFTNIFNYVGYDFSF